MRITAKTKSATYQRILTVATRLFLSDGWEQTTTREISTAAGIATGTLFNYFKSKESLAATLISEALEQASDDVSGETLEEALFALVGNGLRSLAHLRPFLAAAAETLFHPLARQSPESPGDSIRECHLAAMERIVASFGTPVPLPAVTVQLYWTLYVGLFSFWAADESPHQEDTLALLDQSLKLFAGLVVSGSKG